MNLDSAPAAGAPGPLSDEARAALFAQSNTPVGHNGRMRVGRPSFSSRSVVLTVAVFVVLTLAGLVIEHVFGSNGSRVTTSNARPSLIGPAHQLDASIQSFMGLHSIGGATPAPIDLTDQHGRSWRLSKQKGTVVVVTFLNAPCNDICPVEGAEIRQAISLLATTSRKVQFVIVNSDPRSTAVGPRPAALVATGLLNQRTVHFVSGSLDQLNAVWVAYGLGVRVGTLNSQVAHNDLMYFIAPNGTMRALAVPFANESHAGVFSLPSRDVQRFAQGIATEAVSLTQ